jgi:hypothetical protein
VAQAQNPCTDPPLAVLLEPNRVAALLDEQTATFADGTPKVTAYRLAFFDQGADPNNTPPMAGPLVIPKSAFALVAGTPNCYSASVPIPVPLVPRVMVAALQAYRDASPTATAEASPYSPVSNPFPQGELCQGGEPVGVLLHDWTKVAKRSDPKGMLIYFDAYSPVRISKVTIDTLGDGEPGWELIFGDQTDGRAVRALAVKPVVNGTWTFEVVAMDARGCTGRATGIVTVTF